MLKRLWQKGFIVLMVTVMLLGMVVVRIYDPAPVRLLRLKTFDFYQQILPRSPPEEWQQQSPVIIVDIDEKSLAEYGQFPWPRYRVAQLIDALMDNDIAGVAFDIVFAEPDKSSPVQTLQAMDELGYSIQDSSRDVLSVINYDDILADAIHRAGAVLAQKIVTRPALAGEAAARSSVNSIRGGSVHDFLLPYPGVITNIQKIEEATAYRGMVSVNNDVDNVVRKVPLVLDAAGVIKPLMSLELLRRHLKSKGIAVRVTQAGIDRVSMRIGRKQFHVPTNGDGEIWVYFAEPDIYNSPDNVGRMYISAGDIISGRVPKEKIAGRMALLGTSAAGLLDLRNTPVRSNQPGVEVHANIIENILSDSYLKYPVYMNLVELLTLMFGALIAVLVLLRTSPWVSLISFVAIVIGYIAVSWWLFMHERVLLDASYPLICLFLIYMITIFWRFRQNAAEKKQVRQAFGQYLSPALVEQLADDPSLLRLGGERREMTILFCDVRGFTAMSELFRHDPEGLTKLINRLLTPLTDVILRHQGTIDKYMGDCIMAFWNAPLTQEKHAELAVQAAAEMHLALVDFNRDLARLQQDQKQSAEQDSNKTIARVKIGIGVNSGSVVVGNMGSDQRFDYSVLGDSVNLASRLEGQSKSYGVATIVGIDTYDLLSAEEQQQLIWIDDIAVKGKQQAVRIYTPTELPPNIDSDDLQQRQVEFMAAYQGQQWDTAARLAQENAEKYPDLTSYYAIMQNRIADYCDNPPPADWDGVYTATTK